MSATNVDLKSRVREHITPFMTDAQLDDHQKHTDNSLASQKDFLKRVIVEKSANPLEEVDSIHVLNDLDENTLCPFINGHMARG